MKILITGNLGYIGPVVCEELKNYNLTGFDNCYFGKVNTKIKIKQFYGDIRKIKKEFIEKFDSIIHLAAISNDPIGNKFEEVTNEINLKASIRLFKIANKVKIKNFVFSSSCSVYGTQGKKHKHEGSKLTPLTAYAKSKVFFENEIKKINCKNMKVTSLRFATACGFSKNFRVDLVLNDFVYSAIKYKKITILSDGKPSRPLIHVNDMARAIHWSLLRKKQKKNPLFINVGSNKNNFDILTIAKNVKKHFKNVKIDLNKNAKHDQRSYKVDFSLFKKMAKNFQPRFDLDRSIIDLKKELTNLTNKNLIKKKEKYVRLKTIENLIENKKISKKLEWIK
jgi:nucleoside-diphosphate-sugar epimerase